jgi:ArsR family transcriptional regulator
MAVDGHDVEGIDGCQYDSAMASTLPLAATCAPLLGGPIDRVQAEELAGALKVLADPARLRLLSLIQAQPDGACVCHLTGPLGLSQPTVSHHVRVLLDGGFVTREQRGSWAHYRVVPDALSALSALLGPTAVDDSAP